MQRTHEAVTERREAHADTPPRENEPARPYPPSWFALQVRSNFEFSVTAAIADAGLIAFLPTWTETVRWTDRTKETIRPLFPGYVFVRCTVAQMARVCRTRGVLAPLSIDGHPAAIPDEEIAALESAAKTRHCSPCAYVAGETVRVKSGPFAGVMGVVSRTKGATTGATTLTIPVRILGRAVSVQIDAADVEAAPEKSKHEKDI